MCIEMCVMETVCKRCIECGNLEDAVYPLRCVQRLHLGALMWAQGLQCVGDAACRAQGCPRQQGRQELYGGVTWGQHQEWMMCMSKGMRVEGTPIMGIRG